MKLALALLMCLPLAGQVGIDDLKTSGTLPGEWTAVKIYEVPTDWATVKRPTLAATVTALKAERTAGECQECLHVSEPGVYQDEKKVIWYAIHHPRIGLVAVQDRALFTEIARCPKFVDGEHDDAWLLDVYTDKSTEGKFDYVPRSSRDRYYGDEHIPPNRSDDYRGR